MSGIILRTGVLGWVKRSNGESYPGTSALLSLPLTVCSWSAASRFQWCFFSGMVDSITKRLWSFTLIINLPRPINLWAYLRDCLYWANQVRRQSHTISRSPGLDGIEGDSELSGRALYSWLQMQSGQLFLTSIMIFPTTRVYLEQWDKISPSFLSFFCLVSFFPQ